MKIVLLTTDTTHHLYFAWKISKVLPIHAILLETGIPAPPFDTAHPFEKERDEYEREVLLAGCRVTYSDLADTYRVESVNNAESVSILNSNDSEVLVTFGTGKLMPRIIGIASVASLNLHGGNPEEYRGLDTHLWAIYHRDFDNLTTTLHYVDAELDTGDIVLQSELPLNKDSRLHTLRSINTRVCVDLVCLALRSLESTGWLPSRKQLKRGRYYSFMPSALKQVCAKNFGQYIARLGNE